MILSTIVNEEEITSSAKSIYEIAPPHVLTPRALLYWWLAILLSYDVDDRGDIARNYL